MFAGTSGYMNWHLQSFDALNTITLYKILQLRSAVFVVEQACAYQDMDDKDLNALHLWCEHPEGHVIAYCRLLPPGISYTESSIGRVVTAAQIRNTGTGRKLMEQAISHLRETDPHLAIRISAQSYLEKFYSSLGFETTGPGYLEDNIPHIEMLFRAGS